MKASLNKICKSFYINLDRRQDRRDHIESTLPFLCERSPAVDGQSLELNPLVKKIFPNLNKITKAEAACAMSHYMIWKTLLNDESSDNYLILEDDVVFEKGFTTFWNHGQSLLLPKDYSLIYLGGCQPWNKPQYHKCLKRYNDCFNRIKKTDFFQPDSHYWHMNASSYILSKKGAKVLCDFVDKNGFTLSLDHFMIYIINDYNSDSLYHLNPLVARQLHEENNNTGEDLNSDIRKDISKFKETIISKHMITYEGNKERVDNFYKAKNIINDLELFPAVDALNNQEALIDYAIENNIISKDTLVHRDSIKRPGKIGCELSYYKLFNQLLNQGIGDDQWVLILEDDVELCKNFTHHLAKITQEATLVGSDYVRISHRHNSLYIDYKDYSEKQFTPNLKLSKNLYSTIAQYGTSGQVLNGRAIKALLSLYPIQEPIDMTIIAALGSLNATTYIENIAKNIGAGCYDDHNSKMGSIINNMKPSVENKKIAYFCPSVLKHKGTTYTLLRTEERFLYKMPDGSHCKDYLSTHESAPWFITHDGWGINYFEAKSWYSLKIDNKLFECKVYINDRLAPRSSLKDLCNSGIGKIEDVRIIENTVVENDKSITCLACCSYFVDIEKLPEPKLGHKSSCYPGFCEVDFTNKTIKVLGYIGEDKIPEYGRTQKNWMPFKHNDTFYCIYSTDPLIYSTSENLKDIYFEPSDLTVKPGMHNATTPINIGGNTYCMIAHGLRTESKTHSYSYKKYFIKFEVIDGKIVNLQKEHLPHIPEYSYCSSMSLDDDGSLKVHANIEDCSYDTFELKIPEFNSLNVIWQSMGGKTKRPWDDPDQDFIIESDWLLYLLGDIKLNHINDDNYSAAQDNSIVIYSDIWPSDTKHLPEHLHQKCKDNNSRIKNYFEKFKDFNNCYLIHLSDEHCLAETSHYKYFKHVFRNIYRDDIVDKNVTFFPLGYKSKEIKKTQEQLIPKKIHQTWETKNITPGIQSYIDKLKNLNPDFDYKLYDKDDRETFLKEHFDDKVFQAYSRIVPGAMKTDLWRYCLLYEYGGIFSDIDLDYISPLPEVINGFSFVCPIDLDNDFNSPHQALNGFLCSSPGHPILKHCIDLVVSNVIDGDWDPLEHHCLDLSGPGALGMSVNFFMGREKRSPLNPMLGEHEISDYKIKLIKTINDTVKDIDETPILSCNKGPGTDLEKAYNELSKQDNAISWSDNNFSARKIVDPSKEIPKVIVQACGNEILLNDSNYEYSCYNKEDCVEFLYKYFNELVVDTFNSLDSELEKSNFFKHCYLYIKGGSYIDSSPPGLSTHLSEIESIIRSTNE